MFRITMLPAEDGDCLLVELGTADSQFRMLIDGGRARTKDRLSALLAGLPARASPALDVVVLTHVDADHIEGLLELLVDNAAPTIGDIWFNGGDHLTSAMGIASAPKRKRVEGLLENQPIRVLSIKQGIDLSRLIEERGWRWNKAFDGGALMTEGAPLPKIPIANGTLTLMGPPKKKLAAFAPEWAAKLEELRLKDTPTLKGRQRPTPQVGNLPMLATQMDQPDRAKPNGTSIAFVIEHGGRRALFTADAHPGDIADALKVLEPGASRIRFDAIKVAHHGSAGNNTSKLLNLLESPLWLVSTSGANHEHPDPEAVARIVLAPTRDKTIAFNYRSAFNTAWDDPALTREYGYQVRYPEQGRSLVVDIGGEFPTFE
jgi:beta-lactamase superfamily II metal-dependent hydrolase